MEWSWASGVRLLVFLRPRPAALPVMGGCGGQPISACDGPRHVWAAQGIAPAGERHACGLGRGDDDSCGERMLSM
jgi:hypothetical protein